MFARDSGGERQESWGSVVDVRLVVLASFLWVGVLVGLATGRWQHRFLVVVGLVILLLLGALWRYPWVTATVATLTLGVGLLAGHWAGSHYEQSAVLRQLEEGGYLKLTGRVLTEPQPGNTPWSKEQQFMKVRSGAVQVVVSLTDGQTYIPGQEVTVRGIGSQFESRQGPMAGVIKSISITEVRSAPQSQRYIQQIRENLRQVTDENGGKYAPLITGMAVGDDRRLDLEVREAMLTTSTTHLTAVSGSHIAISMAAIRTIVPGRRKLRYLTIAVFLLSLVLVVGATPSVLRASGMAILTIWGLLLRRAGQPLALLATVTIIGLLLNPWNALSLGFTLSVVATGGILTLGKALINVGKDWLGKHEQLPSPVRRALNVAWDAFAIAFSAHVVTLPILALVNPWLPTWGIIANLAVAPVVAPLTLLALGTAITTALMPNIAPIFSGLAAPLAHWMGTAALHIAQWPMARAPWPQGPAGFLLAAIIQFLVIGGTAALFKALPAFQDRMGQLKWQRLWERVKWL